MTSQDQQDSFDRQARAHYRDAAETLSPAMQGRLRAARRTALAATDGGQREAGKRVWSVLPLAAMAAAVFALAIGLHWQRGADNELVPSTGTTDALPVAVETGVDPVNPQRDVGNPDVSTPESPTTNMPDTAVSNTDAPETVVPAPAIPDPVAPKLAAPDPATTQRMAMEPQAPDASEPSLSSDVDPALLVLEEDPDFYLWLGGDDAYPAGLEPPNDAT